MNLDEGGDLQLAKGAYCAGQVLFDKADPTKIIDRLERNFLRPAPDRLGAGRNSGAGSGDPGDRNSVLTLRPAGRFTVPALSGLDPVRELFDLWLLAPKRLKRFQCFRGLALGETFLYTPRDQYGL